MITIHEAKAADTTTLGLGALLPSKCLVREKAGGMYELTLEHPMTEDMRHERIKPMRLIKAPAPVRETPLVEINQTGSVTRDIYRVNTVDVRLNMRAGASMDSKVIHAYKPGTEVVKLGEDGDWMQVAILDGGATGWMWADYLEYVRTETEIISGDSPGGVVQPRQTREQLFRVYRYNPDTKTRTVYADARHITYDLAGAIVEGAYDPENVEADVVCAQLMARADHDVSDFHIYCTVADKISGSYGGRNIIDCLLDPETGVVAQTKARIVRDNYDIFILPDEARIRGVELRYGKNLVSASMDTDVSDIITRIRPVGKDEDGNKLYITENNGYVDSPYINDYPVILSKEVEYDVAASDELPIDEARAMLKEKAEAEFVAGCDMATVKLDADFVRLELTEDYRQLANAYALHLYDSVPVIDREADIVATARMVEYAYEATLDEYESTGLGELEEVKSTIYGYELVDKSVQGGKVIPNTLNGDRLQNFSVAYGKFDIAAIKQLSADAITAIRAEIRDLVAGNITTDQLYTDLAYIAAAQITAANIDKANIQWAEIESLTAEIAKVANAEIAKADIEWAQIRNVEIEAADIADLTATVADIVRAEVAEIKIGTAQIEDAAITSAKIALGAITAALIENGAIGTAQIADGSITEAKIVSLNADVITAGTLSVERLLIKGPDGLFRAINATDEGLTAAELDSETYQSALSGTVLVARSVTADKIAAKSITANEILSGTITAAEIDVTNLFAAQATIAALDSYIMRTTTIEALEGSLDVWAEEKIALRIAGKADQSDVDALGDRMTEAESEIIQQAGSISANATAIETVSQSANAAQDAADAAQNTANAAQNTANAAQGSADANADNLTKVASRVTTAEANISALEGEIETKVSQTDFNALGGRVSTAESAITLNADQIETKVSQTDFNALGGRVSTAETAIEQNSTDIVLLAGRTVGGTNYLLDSGVEISNSAYHIADYYFSEALKPKAGETVTIRIWGTLGTGRTEFCVYNTNGYIQIGMLTNNGDGTHSGTFTWRTESSNYPSYSQTDESQTHVQIYARPNNSAITSISTIKKIKMELGNTATDWSAHPEELNAGSSVRINENEVNITTPKFEVNILDTDGETNMLTINEDGAVLKSGRAPNITPRYDGPTTLYVNPNATSAQIAAGNYFRSLADASAAINYKWIDKGITINLAAGMVEYGTVTFHGTCGGQWITIKGDSTNHAKLVGKLLIYLCMSHVSVQYLDIDSPVNQRAIDVSGGYADISNCVITGKGTAATVNGATNGSSIGILAEQGARVVTGSCEIYDVYRSLYTQTAGQLQSSNNKGNCTVGANRTHMFVSGTAPCASTSWTYSEVSGGKVWASSDVTVNQGSKPTAEAEPTTVNYNFTYADSYAGGWSYFEDADARQGYVNGRRIYGTIWFNASAIKTALAGKTIKQASLRLYMQSGVGRGVSVSVQMYGTSMAYDGRSGAPALTTSYGTIGSTAPGQLNEITIPTQVITDIVNGTIQALVLYSDDTDYYSGRSYSKNYARFDGSTSGDSSTRPRLTVVYS